MKFHAVHTTSFWRSYWVHMRPYLLFVSGAAGLSGMALSGRIDENPVPSLLAFLAFFFSYGFGQALTDCFQIDTDSLSAEYRPMSQGIVSPRDVGMVSLIGLLVIGVVLVWLNPWNLPLVVLSIFGLATYSFVKKRFWIAGPVYNAWIVMLLPMMGYLSVAPSSLISEGVAGAELGSLLLLTLVAYTHFVLMGYLKDVSADRLTGYTTFPVRWGYGPTVWASDVLLAAAIFLCAELTSRSTIGFIFLCLGSFVGVVGQVAAHLTKDRKEANTAFPILATVRGFMLWQLAVVATYWETGWVSCIAYYVAFEVTLRQRPEHAQI